MERISPEQRERIRDRLAERFGEHGEGGEGLRERIRDRVRDRLASRYGDDSGRCFYMTRILRSEDGDVTALVRRRICRD